MCFSAKASFTASALLFIIGVMNIRTNENSSLKVFSFMPLLFAIQQFSEGMLWVSFKFPGLSALQTVSKYFFLTFAIVIWPVFVSSSLLILEKEGFRRKLLKFLTFLSSIWAVSAVAYMFVFQPSATVAEGHIMYDIFLPYKLPFNLSMVYGVLTVVPFFLTRKKMFWIFGTLVTITGTMTYIVYASFFTSIWCFFAAIVSTHTYAIVRENNLETPWELNTDINLPFTG